MSLADCTRLMTMAARCPANSLPQKSQARLPIAHGLIWRSMKLLSIGTVMSRLARAREKLRGALTKTHLDE